MWKGLVTGEQSKKQGNGDCHSSGGIDGDEAESYESLSESARSKPSSTVGTVVIDVDEIPRRDGRPSESRPERLYVLELPTTLQRSARSRVSIPGAFGIGLTVDVDGDEPSPAYDTWLARPDPTAPDSIILVPRASVVGDDRTISSMGTRAAENYVFEASLIRANVAPEDAVIMSRKKLKLMFVLIATLTLALGVSLTILTEQFNRKSPENETITQAAYAKNATHDHFDPSSPSVAPSSAATSLNLDPIRGVINASFGSSLSANSPSTIPSHRPSTAPSLRPRPASTGSSAPSNLIDNGAQATTYAGKSPQAPPTFEPTAPPATISPTKGPTFQPTAKPTQSQFTRTPTPEQSPPGDAPTQYPTPLATSKPSVPPTESPTTQPSLVGKLNPTGIPTKEDTESPTDSTSEPTVSNVTETSKATDSPTTAPSGKQSAKPAKLPTANPTIKPTGELNPKASEHPNHPPTVPPTRLPTNKPTDSPTPPPTGILTSFPTQELTQQTDFISGEHNNLLGNSDDSNTNIDWGDSNFEGFHDGDFDWR